ncbi:hypothetical protein SALBM311S_04720 [Streptomyces alboniger]
MPVRRQPLQQCGERVPVGHITSRDRDPSPQLLQLRLQFHRTRSLKAPPTGEDEMLGTAAGQPPRHMPTDSPGTTRDQRRTPSRPPRGHLPLQHSRHKPPHENTGTTHRELILITHTRQNPSQTSTRTLIDRLRQIDQPTPQLRMLQRHHPAQPPHLRLHRLTQPVTTPRGHRTTRHRPQRGADFRVTERLHQCERARQPHRHSGLIRPRCLIKCKQGNDAGDVRNARQSLGQSLPRHLVDTQTQFTHLGTGLGDGIGDPRHPRMADRLLRNNHQPATRQSSHRQPTAQRLPHHPITPAVHHRPLTPLPPPRRQPRQHSTQRLLVDIDQRRSQRLQILPLHRLPKTSLHLVHSQTGTITGLRVRLRQPVVLTLERIRGQLDQLGPGKKSPPVQLHAVHVRLGERGHEAVGAAFIAAQGAQRGGGRVAGVVDGRLHRNRQHRVRAHLQEQRVPLGQQTPRRLLEQDRVAEIAVPVTRVHRLVQPRPGQRGEHRDVGGSRCDGGQSLGQPLLDRLDMRGVRGVVHWDGPGPDVISLAVGDQLPQGVRLTADHHLRRTVHRGDIDTALPAADQLPNLPDRQRHRHHATLAGKRPDGLAAQRDHAGGVLQGERTRHTRRGDLTLTVTHHGRGPHTGRPPHLGQRHHHREQHRLDHIHPIEVLTTQLLEQIPLDEPRQRCGTLTHPLREHRTRIQQLDRHPRPLRPLPRKHEHRTRSALDSPACDHARRGGVRPGQSLQPRQQLLPVPAQHHTPMLEPRPRSRQRPSHVRRFSIRAGPHAFPQPRRLPPQRVLGLGRQHQRHHTRRRRPGLDLPYRFRLGCLLQQHMGVGPAHAERRHTGPAWPVTLRPLPGLGQQPHNPRRPVHVRTRRIHVQRGRKYAVTHGEDHLDDTGDTGGGLRVPDVRLDRPQPQRPILRPPPPIGRDERLRLDRVTQRRTSPVRLHHVHITGRQPRVRQRSPDHPLLRRPIGSRQTIARPVLIDGRTPHHRQHPMPVPPRVGQAFQDQHPHTLTGPEPVGAVGERLAAAVLREAALAAEGDEGVRGGHDGGAAGEGHVALALPQRLRGQVQGDQRGRAGRVDRHRRTLQAERVRDTAGDHAGGVAGHEVAFEALGDLADALAVPL